MSLERPRVRYWRAKLANAQAAHAAEMARMSQPGMGASLRALDSYSRAISHAERKLAHALRDA